jgi:hypothetical protein
MANYSPEIGAWGPGNSMPDEGVFDRLRQWNPEIDLTPDQAWVRDRKTSGFDGLKNTWTNIQNKGIDKAYEWADQAGGIEQVDPSGHRYYKLPNGGWGCQNCGMANAALDGPCEPLDDDGMIDW